MLPIFQNAYVQMQVFGRRSLIPFVACLSSFLQLPKFLTFFSIASRGVTRGCKGAHFRERRITAGVPKTPNNAKSTFFNTVHLLPKDLRIEYGDAKLVSFPGRHLTSLRPDCIIFGVKTFDEIRQSGCLTMSRVLKASIKRPCFLFIFGIFVLIFLFNMSFYLETFYRSLNSCIQLAALRSILLKRSSVKFVGFSIQDIGVGKETMPPKFLAYFVILCLDRWFPKQNIVARLTFVPQKNFELAALLTQEPHMNDQCVQAAYTFSVLHFNEPVPLISPLSMSSNS